MQELVRPLLERGRRRGALLVAREAVHDVVWDGGPADELGLERRDRGNGLWCGTDPQEACVHILLDRRIKHLCEERRQRIIPADDHRQAWLLCRNTVATHRHLAGGGWWWAYGETVTAMSGPPPLSAQERVVRERVLRRTVSASRGSWRAWGLCTAAALAGGGRPELYAAPRWYSLPFAVAAIGELVAKPAGAAGVAVVPAHRGLVLGTPARVVVVRTGEALGVRRLGRRRRGALLGVLTVVPGGLR